MATSTIPNDSGTGTVGTVTQPRPGRWIDHWDPEEPSFWAKYGKSVATRNLAISVFAEFLGFAVWAMWSVVVPNLNKSGFSLTVDQMFWLTSLPVLVGATLRMPYTFAVPIFGGRNFTIISALLLLFPTLGLIYAVNNPEISYTTLLLIASLAGLGGGNFASSMANISFFYPEQEKGRALGLNAAGGNLGTAVVQFVVPLIIVAGASIALDRVGYMFIPLIVLAAVLAWRMMDNLSNAKSDYRSYAVAAKHPHTWIISFLYIGTFGSFIGYSASFPLILKSTFPEVSLNIAYLGALVGSLSRPLGGMLADKIGGALVTIGSYFAMAAGALAAVFALQQKSFGMFVASFLVLFVASGIGNGSIYRMIPAVFAADASGRDRGFQLISRRSAAGCLGVAGAIGAFGGFGVGRGFAIAREATGSIRPALLTFVAVYLVMLVVTWVVYRRPGARMTEANV